MSAMDTPAAPVPLPPGLHQAPLDDWQRALAEGRCRAIDAVEHVLARCDATDTRVHAVVVRRDDAARAEARAADEARARGDTRPLLGVPISVKESFDVAGLPTTWGLPGPGHAAARDAVAVARLKAAGAIVIGKTNVPPMLSDWQSSNPVHGRTLNPWHAARTPGGSSGGSAAALAAGLVPLELGSDIGGSLRVPAHCCGVYAHKPSHGLIPLRGAAPPQAPRLEVSAPPPFAVAGPMARAAEDLALALELLAGPDDADATAWRLALPAPRHATLAAHRVLVLDTHPLLASGRAVREALQALARRLRDAGCTVATDSPLLPDLRRVAELYGQQLLAVLAADLPPAAMASAASGPADDPMVAARATPYADWVRWERQALGIAQAWRRCFEAWDVVVTPVLPVPAFAHDDQRPMPLRQIDVDGRSLPYLALGAWAGPASLSGLPATAMPIGLSPDGLPIGAQVIGPRWEDLTPIRFAALCSQAFGGYQAPPDYRD